MHTPSAAARLRRFGPVASAIAALAAVTIGGAPASAQPSPAPPPADGGEAPDVDVVDVVDEAATGDPYQIPTVNFRLRPGDVTRVGGSAHLVTEEELERFHYDDPNKVLVKVPGVYIRQEDGYGLRPNIGLRGASSDRSKKVTLMEDGVLFAPAPYAAPAAYYFPLIGRMTGVEVFKGPAAILFGPHTIGGAINLLTRDIPLLGAAGELDLAGGMYGYRKGHFHWGVGTDWGGLLVEGMHVGSEGFKELDGGGDTGFAREELMVKGRWQTTAGDLYHQVDVKLGYSHERSNETYVGLTDADFEANPNRRYAASALGRMKLNRASAQLRYTLGIGEDVTIFTTAYYQTMARAWRKLNGFGPGAPSLASILASPDSGQRRVFYDVLRGAEDSSSEAEQLLIGTNAREYVAYGVASDLRAAFETGEVTHDVKLGVRLHYDEIARDHIENAYDMRAGRLVATGAPTVTTALNEGRALAFAAYLQYGVRWQDLTLTPGVRLEHIAMAFDDRLLGGPTAESTQTVVLPGLGAHYALTPELGVLAGVHQGFSPVAPGQSDDVEPEKSLNFELGARYGDEAAGLRAEVVGFYSDYDNLLGQCTFSTGCPADQLDRQVNVGEVTVYGVEASGSYAFALGGDMWLPLSVSYTFTHGELDTSFVSDNPQYGEVEAGDALPYVPEHQVALTTGVTHADWGALVSATVVSPMREVAGKGEPAPGEATDTQVYVDLAGHWQVLERLRLYVRVDNVLFQDPIVARAPFGARPGKPFSVMGGVTAKF